jgi:phage terminase small subunit
MPANDKPLTMKQEKFCQAYVETGNASEAYRRAYDASKTKPDVIHVKASQLLADGRLSVRVAELKALAAERHNMTVDDIRNLLTQDREFARELEAPAAAVAASMGMAKLYGHLRDKVEHTGELTINVLPEDAGL